MQPKVIILLDGEPNLKAIGPVTRYSPAYAKILRIIRDRQLPYIDTQVIIESPGSFILNEE